jgi:hypothetical protein
MEKQPRRRLVPLEVNVQMLLQSALEVGQSIAAFLSVEFASTDNVDVSVTKYEVNFWEI